MSPPPFRVAPTGPWSGTRRSTTYPPVEMEPSSATPATGSAGSAPVPGVVAPSAVSSAPVATRETGAATVRPIGATRPPLPPGPRLPYDPYGREWRKPPRPAEAAATAPLVADGGGVPAPPGPGPASPGVLPHERPPFLGQVASALPPRAGPFGVRTWLVGRNSTLAAAYWPHVRHAFEAAHPLDAPFIPHSPEEGEPLAAQLGVNVNARV